MSHRDTLRPIPLLHDGDSFIIYLKQVGTKCVRIIAIHRFPHNQNTEGVEEDFRDLDQDAKRAVIRQINAAHVGRTILV